MGFVRDGVRIWGMKQVAVTGIEESSMAANALWSLEEDWLVEVVLLPKDEPEAARAVTMNWIGRLHAFAGVTNTRMVAQVGDLSILPQTLGTSPCSVHSQRYSRRKMQYIIAVASITAEALLEDDEGNEKPN